MVGQQDGTLVVVYKANGNNSSEYKFKSTMSGWTGEGVAVPNTVDANGWTTIYLPINNLSTYYDGFEAKTQILFYWDDGTTKNADFYIDSIRAVNYENVEYAPANVTAEVGASFNLVPEEIATTYEGVEFSYFVNGVKAENPAAYTIADEGSYTVTYEGTSANKLISGAYTVKAYVKGRFILINASTVSANTGSAYVSEYQGVKNVVKVGKENGETYGTDWQHVITNPQFAHNANDYADYDTLTLKVWTDTAQTFTFSGVKLDFDGKMLGNVDREHLNQWITLSITDKDMIAKLLTSGAGERTFDFYQSQGNVYIADFILTKSGT